MMKYFYIFTLLLTFNSTKASGVKDSITIYYFLLEDCKICQYYTDTFEELYNEYDDDHTSFIGLFPNRFSSEENIALFKKKYNIPFPLKREYFQTKTKEFGVTVTPEVVVFNETENEIVYRGRIDNSYVSLGKRRRVVTSEELKSVLTGIRTKGDSKYENTDAVGCFIQLIK